MPAVAVGSRVWLILCPVDGLDLTQQKFAVVQQAALHVAGGHYGYGSYQNAQLPASSAPRAPPVGNMYLPSNYNL